jgi:hypothetical protein
MQCLWRFDSCPAHDTLALHCQRLAAALGRSGTWEPNPAEATASADHSSRGVRFKDDLQAGASYLREPLQRLR